MNDVDIRGAILLGALFVLAIFIGVLGSSVLLRVSRAGGVKRALPGWRPGPVLVTLVLLVVAFLAISLPYLSVVPALLFLFFGIRALGGGRGLPREGGAVMLLAGLGWLLYAAYQAVMLAWSITVNAPIRLDTLIALPIMGVISFIGWRVQSSLAAVRL